MKDLIKVCICEWFLGGSFQASSKEVLCSKAKVRLDKEILEDLARLSTLPSISCEESTLEQLLVK